MDLKIDSIKNEVEDFIRLSKRDDGSGWEDGSGGDIHIVHQDEGGFKTPPEVQKVNAGLMSLLDCIIEDTYEKKREDDEAGKAKLEEAIVMHEESKKFEEKGGVHEGSERIEGDKGGDEGKEKDEDEEEKKRKEKKENDDEDGKGEGKEKRKKEEMTMKRRIRVRRVITVHVIRGKVTMEMIRKEMMKEMEEQE